MASSEESLVPLPFVTAPLPGRSVLGGKLRHCSAALLAPGSFAHRA